MHQKRFAMAVFAVMAASALAVPGIFIAPGPAHAAAALVQNTSGVGLPPTAVVSFPSATTQGDLLVVSVEVSANGGGTPTFSVSDNKGNTYALAKSVVYGGNLMQAMYYVANAAGGTNHQITVAASGNGLGSVKIVAGEYSGIATASPLDKTASASGWNTLSSGNTATLSQANELVVGSLSSAADVLTNVGVGSGYTKVGEADNQETLVSEYQIVNATAPVAATFSASADTNAAIAATFKVAGTTGTTQTTGTTGTTTSNTAQTQTTVVQQAATTAAADTQAPSVPTGLAASAISPSGINVTWNPSTDNVGVTGYHVYRNGTLVSNTTVTSFSDSSLSAATAYSYTVSAYDAAGNSSAQTAAVSATTQAAGTGGSVYHVGPGQQYTTLSAVPWYALKAGDTVYIHYQSTPYREKFLVSGQGTASNWIHILGVPDPTTGALPVISGANAVTSPNSHYHWQSPTDIQWDGVIQIAVRSDSTAGSDVLPSYIEIANLQVQDGNSTNSFTAENGAGSKYDDFSACIYARSVKHLLVRNSIMTNCGLGFYNWQGDGSGGGNTWWDGIEVDTTLRQNYFYGNGDPNLYSEHQTYTESDGMTIEGNHYGPPKNGMLGSQLKDRSAGTVIRYNYIEQSPSGWDLDLVDSQNGCDVTCKENTYLQTFVYGNIIYNNGNAGADYIHWNEDQYTGVNGRAEKAGSKLFFYDNTVLAMLNASDEYGGTETSLFNEQYGGFDCNTKAQPGVTDLRNNVFAVLPRTAGAAPAIFQFGYCGNENFAFGPGNWISPGWTTKAASVTGASNVISPAANNPGFVNASTGDVHLAAGSPLIGAAGALAPEVTSNYLGLNLTPTQQYVYHLQFAPRASIADIGALAYGAPTTGTSGSSGGAGSGTTPSNPSDTTAPTVAITTPANGATVAGSVAIAATASDNVGVASVQFKLDGTNLGALDTTLPYSATWNSASSTNGTHTISATASDAAGNTASASVTVTANNSTTVTPTSTPTAPDTQAPTPPTSLKVTASTASSITLSWAAGTDNVGVTGYKVYRNGTQVGTTANTTYTDTGLAASANYPYTVAAYDAAGNLSLQSATVNAATQAATGGTGGTGTPTSTPPSGGSGSTDILSSLNSLLALIQQIRTLTGQLFTAANTGNRSLSIGMTGQDVWALQVLLIVSDGGPNGQKLAVAGPSGTFDALTKAAVMEFQKMNGIYTTGTVGPMTRAALLK